MASSRRSRSPRGSSRPARLASGAPLPPTPPRPPSSASALRSVSDGDRGRPRSTDARHSPTYSPERTPPRRSASTGDSTGYRAPMLPIGARTHTKASDLSPHGLTAKSPAPAPRLAPGLDVQQLVDILRPLLRNSPKAMRNYSTSLFGGVLSAHSL